MRRRPDGRVTRAGFVAACAIFGASVTTIGARGEAAGDGRACTVVLIDGAGDGDWQAAVQRAQRSVAPTADCQGLEVHRTRSGAVVVLTTRAGHQAIRTISSPEELEATVGALLVTLPELDLAPSPSATPAPSTSIRPPPIEPPPIAPAIASTAPPPPLVAPPAVVATLVLFAGVETRVTVQNHLVGAVGVAGAIVDWNAWRVGLQGTWESYELGDSNGADIEGSGVSIGLSLGRRFRVNDAIAATLDGRIALGALSENRELSVDVSEIDRTRVEARFGLDLGLEIPLITDVRARPWVAFEWMPARLGSSSQPDPLLPAAPTLAVAGGFALEIVAR